MPPAPRVSIVIPVFNKWELTEACLHSLAAHTPGEHWDLIVADNGSTDATAAALEPLGRGLFGERFHRLRFDDNRNFGPACNAGAGAARGEQLFFLNNDTLVPPDGPGGSGWLGPLLEAMAEDPKLGATGPLLTYEPAPLAEATVQHCGVAFAPTLGVEHLYAHFPATHPAVHRRRRLQALTGAALMLPRQRFLDCGGFHEGYVNGCEDIELCCRLRQAGYVLRLTPASRLAHLESRTPGRFDRDLENMALLNERTGGCFVPDLHRHALRDGFSLGLSEGLQLYLRPAPEREEALRPLALEPDPAAVWAMLQKEPLWEAGYAGLAGMLEQAGRFAEAAQVRLALTHLAPRAANYRALAKTAHLAGEAHLGDTAMAAYKDVMERAGDAEGLARKASKLADWAGRADEPELEALYRAASRR